MSKRRLNPGYTNLRLFAVVKDYGLADHDDVPALFTSESDAEQFMRDVTAADADFDGMKYQVIEVSAFSNYYEEEEENV